MQDKYVPAEVESAARAHWDAIDAYRVTERADKPKFYACSMLPYPSGKLHMGHVRNYTINDMMARQLRMAGFNVLMPMGWDAFGLPAENAAMKHKVPPAQWTWDNIAHMKGQMQAMGLAIDWSREAATCSPEYYKWNQWLFLKMLEKGIAYKKTQIVNWDPVDQTVLANEQVIDGRGWRSGAVVEKREIPGYYLAITKYADELLDCVQHKLTGWPERVRLMQENWIGKSFGVNFGFPYELNGPEGKQRKLLRVFTTRADTIMGVTFCAVAAEHPLAAHVAKTRPEVAAFIEECKKGGTTEAEMAALEKKGVPTGFHVTHPLTGAPVEVWVGNYVLMGYGEGAVMGVPAHDERDFAFAKKYGIDIKPVIVPARHTHEVSVGDAPVGDAPNGKWHGMSAGRIVRVPNATWQYDKSQWHDEHAELGYLFDSRAGQDGLDGLSSQEAVDVIATELRDLSRGDKQTTWRLRDWGVSRQRYWGTPIPIIHCDTCSDVPVPYADLPVKLPEDLVPDGSGNPLAKDERFLKCTCPKCGKPARRETDTMDTFVDSSWYYMRYCSPGNDAAMVDARNDYWMPMDQYIGGIEHAVLHLLYARFWTKVMRDLGLVKFDEPFKNLLTQGMVLNHIYSRKSTAGGIEYFWPDEVENIFGPDGRIVGAKLKSDGSAVEYGGVGTMSKSKNNGVDPQQLIDQYGADTARLFTMFAAPPEQTLEWNDAGVEGAHRFLKRLWALAYAKHGLLQAAAPLDARALPTAHKALRRQIHLTLQQADHDYRRMQYNTVVSAAMKMLNAIDDAKLPEDGAVRAASAAVTREALSILIRVLYPAVPHIAHGLWTELGYVAELGDILDAPWPVVDPAALEQDEIELVVQVNGKLRGSITVPKAADKAALETAALADANVRKFVDGQTVKKVVVVPGKLINVVV